jgi:hypothetical protein
MNDRPFEQFRPGVTVRGPLLPEPIEVIAVLPVWDAVKNIGKAANSGRRGGRPPQGSEPRQGQGSSQGCGARAG